MKITKQLESWQSEFGKEYTDRSSLTSEEMDRKLGDYTGTKKSDIFREFIPKDLLVPGSRVLEVGCNVGVQLRILQKLNPDLVLSGVDPLEYALSKARKANPDMSFTHASGSQLPFEDSAFDLVMTNSVLIHIDPDDLGTVLAEIYRCANSYIFVHEYYSDTVEEVSYRGNEELLWRADFVQRYLDQFPELKVVKMRYLDYEDPESGKPLRDQVCLLKKEK